MPVLGSGLLYQVGYQLILRNEEPGRGVVVQMITRGGNVISEKVGGLEVAAEVYREGCARLRELHGG